MLDSAKLNQLTARFNSLQNKMAANPDPETYVALASEYSGLQEVVEKIADFIHPEFHEKIGFIKDIAAGAVMMVSIASAIIGMIIYLPKIF